jgi:glycosyltransferase involved in cell wall biosynthesis
MKILYVIPTMGCGGAEVLLANMARKLVGLGHEVAIYCILPHHSTWPNFPDKELLENDVSIQVLGGAIKFRFLHKPHIENSKYIEFVRNFKPDVIHAHLYMSELLVQSTIFEGVNYFSHGHDNVPQLKRFGLKTLFNKALLSNWWERRWLMKQYAKSQSQYIAISKDVETYLKENCPSLSNRITLLPNAIDTARFYVNRDFSVKKNTFKILSVGSLVSKKNHIYLIGLAKILKTKGFIFEINVLGDGPLKEQLINQSREANCSDCLFFRGAVPDVPRWMAESQLYIHPANYEPFGLVLIEAMTSGMPVISLDGRGNRGLITHGETGYFLPVSTTPETFVNYVEEFLYDREKLKEMGKKAQEFSKIFDMETYTINLIQLYKNPLCG